MKAPFLALLPYCALANPLQQKHAQLASLQNQLDSQLAHYQNVIQLLSQVVHPVEPTLDNSEDAPSAEQIYQDMDETTLKLTSLISRTKALMRQVGDYNKQTLQEANIPARLEKLLEDELTRRDKFVHWKSTHLSTGENKTTNNATLGEDYMSLDQLHTLFDNFVDPTEKELAHKVMEYTKQTLNEMEINQSNAMRGVLDEAEKKYAAQFESILSVSKKQISAGSCVSLPQSVDLVEKELHKHYLGVNMTDFASYENGGSVVYALTSNAYRPAPRNTVQPNSDDKAIERMHYEQQAYLEDGRNQILRDAKQWIEQNDPKEWYANYKLGKLRPYLPTDWERAIDWVHNSLSTRSWDNFTPRGAMDALIPDYAYQSLGFGGFGQTVAPEVAISSVSGSKYIGQCFPLSMNAVDDPALAYMSRLDGFDMTEGISSFLSGPKYTVRLPEPIYIDAVSLEHRSFPISKDALSAGLKGGESAPRHVRVIGFAPCPDEDDEDCTTRGFDVTNPIDLGSLEYQRVTVSGREDDYGGYEGNEETTQKRRMRSTQTFAVNGGTWKLQTGLEEETSESPMNTDPEQQCSFDDLECNAKQAAPKDTEPHYDPLAAALAAQGGGGECKPNYEDMTAVPDCGSDSQDNNIPLTKGERNIVAAVSFIIEENWGNPEYTCLYRVQVHGYANQA
ncbi:hypothetical protein ACHAWO_005941 [Cyclotella atomus]|uniref:SUN domain-containing protein n=1 Tax=Cyclotella atomus TaxID=382360 RepID=A0ABD3N6L8_9STRA